MGVAPHEIAFVHDAKNDAQREDMFERTRKGEIRVLLGSTAKLGTGTNIQSKLYTLHHLDVPWRPSEDGYTSRYINKTRRRPFIFKDSLTFQAENPKAKIG